MALSTIQNNSFADTAVHGRRNLIINGAMQVAQRGTSFDGAEQYLCDRWRFGRQTDGYNLGWSQSTTAPDGFANSLKLDVTTADTSLNANVFALVQQRFEGQNLQMLKKGTSAAESVTVSFYVRSAKTGTYILELKDKDNGRQISKSYSISSANTWEYKSITFEGDTTGAFDNDNARSLDLNWWLAAGTNFSSGTLATSWQADADTNRAVGQVNIFDSTSNDWYITGVQLEVGSQATPFEHRSYGEELSLCQRYFIRFANTTANPGTDNAHISMGLLYGGRFYGVMQLPKEMRTYPSGSSTSNGFTVFDPDGGGASGTSIDEFYAPSSHTVRLRTSIDAALQADSPAWVAMYTASAVLDFDAEL